MTGGRWGGRTNIVAVLVNEPHLGVPVPEVRESFLAAMKEFQAEGRVRSRTEHDPPRDPIVRPELGDTGRLRVV